MIWYKNSSRYQIYEAIFKINSSILLNIKIMKSNYNIENVKNTYYYNISFKFRMKSSKLEHIN